MLRIFIKMLRSIKSPSVSNPFPYISEMHYIKALMTSSPIGHFYQTGATIFKVFFPRNMSNISLLKEHICDDRTVICTEAIDCSLLEVNTLMAITQQASSLQTNRHFLLGGSNKVQQGKLLPCLMNGVTFSPVVK